MWSARSQLRIKKPPDKVLAALEIAHELFQLTATRALNVSF